MTEYLVTFSEPALRTLINDPTLTSGRARACPAGLNRLAGRLEFLVHLSEADQARPSGDVPRVIVLREARPELLGHRLDEAPFYAPNGAPTAVVALGVGAAAGRLMGVVRVGNSLRTLDRVRIAGAGMTTVTLSSAADDWLTGEPSPWPWPEEEVLSRTIGALGEDAWRRLRRLHVALVGCGRTGSLLGVGLRKLGLRRLTLLDADRLERHNLGEMDGVVPAHVGRPKAEALADALAGSTATTLCRPRGLTAVTDSVLSLPGLVALKPADVLVCCADNDGARLATGLLAALYLKPLLDIGTGVLHAPGPDGRRLGADIRLVLPGSCLLCLGGVADLAAARRTLRDGQPVLAADDWRRARRGSLRSLNCVAVNLGLRLLEDLVAGHLSASVWLRLETDATGLPTLDPRRTPAIRACSTCALTGMGDAGMRELRRWVEGE